MVVQWHRQKFAGQAGAGGCCLGEEVVGHTVWAAVVAAAVAAEAGVCPSGVLLEVDAADPPALAVRACCQVRTVLEQGEYQNMVASPGEAPAVEGVLRRMRWAVPAGGQPEKSLGAFRIRLADPAAAVAVEED